MRVRTTSAFGVEMPSCTTPIFFGLNITLVNSKSTFEIQSRPYILIITVGTGHQINNIGAFTSRFTSDIIYSTCNLPFEYSVRYKKILANITFVTTVNKIFNLFIVRRK